jgi:hypothetical protein
MTLCPGQTFAEECMVLDSVSLYTIKCKSVVGEIYTITDPEFVRRIKVHEGAIKALQLNSRQKAIAV